MSRILLAAMWIGVATRYGTDSPRIYTGNPLFCDRGDGKCYSVDMEPWVALPVRDHGIRWECGDIMVLFFDGGETLTARAFDAGPFGANCVMQNNGDCIPIVVDVPNYHFPFYPDLSHLATMINVSYIERETRACFGSTLEDGITEQKGCFFPQEYTETSTSGLPSSTSPRGIRHRLVP